MIRKIKIKFSFIIVAAVFVILFLIIGSLNIYNYQNVSSNADDILEILAMNNGAFINRPSNPNEENPISPELPFETRYFTVEVYGKKEDDAENIYFSNVQNIAAVDEKMAIRMTRDIFESDSKRGYSGTYRYIVVKKDISTLVIYVDWSKQLEVTQDFLIASIVITFISLIGVFFVAYLASNRVLAPIIRGYEKQSRFIANASHEIKTPLAIISANNELIEIECGENESTQVISKQIGKMNKMISSLTVLAKLENFKKNGIVEKIDFSMVLKNTINDYSSLLEKFVLNIDIEEHIELSGDEGLIHQMICILLDNAIKYSNTKVNISLRKNNKKTELIISNDANDIEQGDLKRFFERFYRSSNVRSTKIEGSGIGLSICSEIVEFHNGTIKAFGENDIFTIKIIL